MTTSNLIDQYKSYLGDLGNIGSRYSTAQSFYLSVVSALVAAIAFVAKDGVLFSKYAWLIIAFVLFVVVLLCYVWWCTLDYYGKLFGAKLAVLKRMEGEPGMLNIFTLEWDELEKRHAGSLVHHEKLLPKVIGVAAAIAAIASIVAAFR